MTPEPISIEPAACPICEAVAPADAMRCAECGYDLAGIGGRPGLYSRAVLIWSAMGLLAVYLITLAIVAATR